MRKALKQALKAALEAPVPERKAEFFGHMQAPPISNFEFICSQIGYIRKWIFGFSGLAFMTALIGSKYLQKDMLWCICAFAPLLALSVITESGRSFTYGMAELELSARFSLKSVVLARLGILGAANLCLLCLLIPLAYRNSGATILQAGAYILCPYLLTVFCGLWVTRKVHGKEAVYLCAGIASFVSTGDIMAFQAFPILYGGQQSIWWIAAFMLLAAGTAKEFYQTIKQTEELAWSL